MEETLPQVSVSCGVSYWNMSNEDSDSVHELFKRADIALYKAKNTGENKVLIG